MKNLLMTKSNDLFSDDQYRRPSVYIRRDDVLGDIVDQGRNVMICGLPDAAFSWQQLQYRLPNKPSPGQLETHMRGTLQEIGLYRPSCLFWYKAECTPSTKMYVRSVGGLTGLVAARHGGPEKFNDMQDLAAAANHVILNVLNDINLLPFNILTMDFVSDQVSLLALITAFMFCINRNTSNSTG